MKKVFFIVGLVSILATFIADLNSVDAQDIGDPHTKGCTQDAQTLDSKSVKISEYNVTLIVQMRWSKKCQAKWVKAYIPSGTNLYLKDNFGGKYVEYTAQVSGWNYGNMDNEKKQLQACVKHPKSEDELCTNFK